MQDDIQSLSHPKWRCQYHIVFAPKFRRKEIYGKLKEDIGKILRTLCDQKGVEIIEAEACPDHIHMLVSIPPSISGAGFIGYLKGKSSLMIFDRHANISPQKSAVAARTAVIAVPVFFFLLSNQSFRIRPCKIAPQKSICRAVFAIAHLFLPLWCMPSVNWCIDWCMRQVFESY